MNNPAGNADQGAPSHPETSNKDTVKGNCPCSMKYLRFQDLNLSDKNIGLFSQSQFLPLLQGMLKGDLRENSSNLTLNVCQKYNDKKFILNERTSISFCASEVATALGIKSEGSAMELKKYTFPTYIDSLKQRFADSRSKKEKEKKGDKTKIVGNRAKRELSTSSLKQILERMPLDSDTDERNYKKLLLFYIVDQFLLPTSEKSYVRSSMYRLVHDLVEFEEINWVQSVLDHILSAAENVASMHFFCSLYNLHKIVVQTLIEKISLPQS